MNPPAASGSRKEAFFRMVMRIMGSIHRFLYRRTRGKIGYNFRGGHVLLLTTTGRKTGKPHTWPLMYIADGDALIVVGSNGGLDRDPAWCHNLRSNPQAEVEIAGTARPMRAEEAHGEEWDRLWQILIAQAPFYDDYRKATQRKIPLMILRAST
jgi:deazaflavin-dependent oxidoreductase (nitroreductase family)